MALLECKNLCVGYGAQVVQENLLCFGICKIISLISKN